MLRAAARGPVPRAALRYIPPQVSHLSFCTSEASKLSRKSLAACLLPMLNFSHDVLVSTSQELEVLAHAGIRGGRSMYWEGQVYAGGSSCSSCTQAARLDGARGILATEHAAELQQSIQQGCNRALNRACNRAATEHTTGLQQCTRCCNKALDAARGNLANGLVYTLI